MPTFLSMVPQCSSHLKVPNPSKVLLQFSVFVHQLLTVPLDAVARVREHILSTPDIYNDTSKVVTGGGWDHTIWPGSSWPSAVSPLSLFPPFHWLTAIQADLDADDVVRGRPIVLQSKDRHALWVSSKILEISMPFPKSVDGGIIVRNGTGHPTGRNPIIPL